MYIYIRKCMYIYTYIYIYMKSCHIITVNKIISLVDQMWLTEHHLCCFCVFKKLIRLQKKIAGCFVDGTVRWSTVKDLTLFSIHARSR